LQLLATQRLNVALRNKTRARCLAIPYGVAVSF
jgi:hypothetical protein